MTRRNVIGLVVCLALWGAIALYAVQRWGLPRAATNLPEPVPLADGGVTSGCGAKRESPRGETFALPGGRRFHVWGPRDHDGTRPSPLVLVLHGWGDSGHHFADWFKMHEHVDGQAFTVYPDAEGGKWDLHGDKDVTFVERVLAATAARYCIDPGRVFAFGFSWGGKLASSLACRKGSPFRAIASGDSSYHGFPGTKEDVCAPTDVFVTVRTHDTDERPDWGRDAAKAWARHDGCSEQTDVVDAAHGCIAYRGCAGGRRVVLCEDTFFDPSWPAAWNHTVRDDYQRLAWRFFAASPER